MDGNSVLSIFNGEKRLLLLVVFCFLFLFLFFVVVVVFFFPGGGKRWKGFFILPCFVCFVNVSVT